MKLRATPVLLLGLALVFLLAQRAQAKTTTNTRAAARRGPRAPRHLSHRSRPIIIEHEEEDEKEDDDDDDDDEEEEEEDVDSLECEVDRCRRVGKVAKKAFRGFVKVSDLVYKWVPVIKDLLRRPKHHRHTESFVIPAELCDCSDECEYY
ncbi:BRCA2 and CDKN1A-interacting protein-like [Trichogramma pretiosum]|uniref:BRCA2 and CDKN1A-interacting protein-like n=1 Tax=Trichogramma pretiosum TaxID=7493 RepID=UPI0006C984D5|nr:BRCA2 and CDKN1A-interacting protein-like [Trichogramma pretiosum]